MATTIGKPVSFAFSNIEGVSEATYLTGKIILQSADFEDTADEEQVRSGTGALVSRNFYNLGYKANLEYIPTGSTLAGVTANVALPAIGTILNITASPDIPSLIKTNWCVVPGGKIAGSNTSAKKITLPIEAHAGITVAAS